MPSRSSSRSRVRSHPIVARLAWALAIVFLLAPAAGQARSLDEAVEELAKSLVSQLQGQQVKSLAILQFSNLSGAQTDRDRALADSLLKEMTKLGSPRIPERVVSERAARRNGYPAGHHFDGEDAAKLTRRMGVDGLIMGTVQDNGSGLLEIRVEVYSSRQGVNLASARTSAEVKAEVKAEPKAETPAAGQGAAKPAAHPREMSPPAL